MAVIRVALHNQLKPVNGRTSLGRWLTAKPLIWFLTLTVGVLIGLELVIANHLATTGDQLAQINSEIERLKGENLQLRSEIAQKTSLVNIEKEAQKLGLVKASNYLYVNQTPLALK